MEAGLGIGELRAGDGSPESFRGTRPLTERAAQLVANSMMPAFAVYVTPTVQAIHLSQVRPEQDAVAVGRGRVDEPRNLVLSQDALRALPDLRQVLAPLQEAQRVEADNPVPRRASETLPHGRKGRQRRAARILLFQTEESLSCHPRKLGRRGQPRKPRPPSYQAHELSVRLLVNDLYLALLCGTHIGQNRRLRREVRRPVRVGARGRRRAGHAVKTDLELGARLRALEAILRPEGWADARPAYVDVDGNCCAGNVLEDFDGRIQRAVSSWLSI